MQSLAESVCSDLVSKQEPGSRSFFLGHKPRMLGLESWELDVKLFLYPFAVKLVPPPCTQRMGNFGDVEQGNQAR